MANLSNINNKLIVTDGGNLLVNATANLATYGGITIDNFSDPSIAMKTTGTSGWLWTQYITSTGTNNFSMGVNQSVPYWCVKAGAGMDSPHLVVNSSGNVGVGTISPSGVKFQTVQTTSGEWTGDFKNYTANGYGLRVDMSNSSSIQSALQVYTGVGTGFVVKNTGKVGIGYTSPASVLHVGSTGTNAYSATITKGSNMKGIINTLSNNADDMVGIYFATGSTTEGTHWSGITGSRSDNASHWGTQLNFYTHNNDVANLNDATQKMVIKGDGNVGIGTTSPAEKLHIRDASTDANVYIKIANDSRDWFMGVEGSNSDILSFKTHDASNLLNITSGGNVGIGVIPAAHYGGYEVLDIGNTLSLISNNTSTNVSILTNNAYLNSGATAWVRKVADEATMYEQVSGEHRFSNAGSAAAGVAISWTERMRIYEDGDVTMGQYSYQQAPTNGILKIRTSGSTANVCYPLLYVGGSTHLATRQYGIGFDPEGYVDRMKMFFGVDGMGNGYSFGDFVWNINTVVDSSAVTPSDEKMRLDKGGDLKLKTGNLAITNTSKGILLGGTGTANQLRIYQHGTWAPQIYYQNATDQANATNTTQVGLYTRIGNICMVQFRLVWNQASGTPAVDNIGIKNLPFQGSTTNTYAEVPCSLIGYTGGPSPRGNLTLTLPGANQTLAIFNDTNNVGNMGNAIGSGTKEIRFSFTYTTN